MLEPLLGSTNAERVLLYLLVREQGYANKIADYFDTDLYGIQKQLAKLENGGVLSVTTPEKSGFSSLIKDMLSQWNCGSFWKKP